MEAARDWLERDRPVLGWLMVPVGFGIGVSLWDKHGPLVGVAALVLYVGLFTWSALRPDGLKRWSAEHRIIGGAGLVPFTFFALAMITELSLWACAIGSLGLSAVVLVIALIRLRRSGARPGR